MVFDANDRKQLVFACIRVARPLPDGRYQTEPTVRHLPSGATQTRI